MSLIEFERFELKRGSGFGSHIHQEHQLAWCEQGVLTVEIDDRIYVLPPTLGLWIPARLPHATWAVRDTLMRGIYLPERMQVAWHGATTLSVSPLAGQLLSYLAGDLAADARARAEAVLFDLLQPVAHGALELVMPRDPRAQTVARLILADPADRRSLQQFARAVQSSARSLLRYFLEETGLTFTQWRVHARMQAAITMLAEGEPVSRVAGAVGYATASAFVAAFHRTTGFTPSGYVAHLELAPVSRAS